MTDLDKITKKYNVDELRTKLKDRISEEKIKNNKKRTSTSSASASDSADIDSSSSKSRSSSSSTSSSSPSSTSSKSSSQSSSHRRGETDAEYMDRFIAERGIGVKYRDYVNKNNSASTIPSTSGIRDKLSAAGMLGSGIGESRQSAFNAPPLIPKNIDIDALSKRKSSLDVLYNNDIEGTTELGMEFDHKRQLQAINDTTVEEELHQQQI